jgi:hypothetical protein
VSAPEWEAGAPYAGPPHYGPPFAGPSPQQWGPPPQQWSPPPYAATGDPPPGWGWTPSPRRPQRPGSVIAAAVLAFASAVLVLIGTFYGAALSALLSLARGPGAGTGPWLVVLELALVGLLVAGGVRVLTRDRRWLLGAAGGQLVLSVYWLVVLDDMTSATVSDIILVFPILYGALAAVAAGLTFLPDARAWTARRPPVDHPGAGA